MSFEGAILFLHRHLDASDRLQIINLINWLTLNHAHNPKPHATIFSTLLLADGTFRAIFPNQLHLNFCFKSNRNGLLSIKSIFVDFFWEKNFYSHADCSNAERSFVYRFAAEAKEEELTFCEASSRLRLLSSRHICQLFHNNHSNHSQIINFKTYCFDRKRISFRLGTQTANVKLFSRSKEKSQRKMCSQRRFSWASVGESGCRSADGNLLHNSLCTVKFFYSRTETTANTNEIYAFISSEKIRSSSLASGRLSGSSSVQM